MGKYDRQNHPLFTNCRPGPNFNRKASGPPCNLPTNFLNGLPVLSYLSRSKDASADALPLFSCWSAPRQLISSSGASVVERKRRIAPNFGCTLSKLLDINSKRNLYYSKESYNKTRSEKSHFLNEESTSQLESRVSKQEEHHESTSQPNDFWVRAEQKLRQDHELGEILTDSVKIIESDYRLNLQPGDTSDHKRLCDFLEAKANEVEEKKWVIRLGDHSIPVRDQLTTVFKNILTIKDVVNTAASASPPASLACAGIAACFTMVVQAVEQHGFLLQGLESTSGLTPRLRVTEELYLQPRTKQDTALLKSLQEDLISLYSKILEFQARALCYLHRHSASQFLRNLFDRDGWADLLQQFEKYENDIRRAVSLIADAGLNQKHEVILKAIHERDIWTTTTARDERVKKFLNLLYTCRYGDCKNRNTERVPGTCEWFTNHRHFQHWQQGTTDVSPGLLWVSADPGCGKSVLTRYLVDELLFNSNERTVCYFFFKDDFPDQRSATSALSVILRQLFIARPQLLQYTALDKLETDGEKFVQSFSDLWNMLISVSANPKAGEIICILDALDECQDSDRDPLMKAISNFYLGPHKNIKLKFLITSRPYNHIQRFLWELKAKQLTIHLSGDGEEELQQISGEISLVIRKRVHDISKQNSLEEDKCSMLTQRLTEVENRTYLWVTLTLDVLENMPDFTNGNIRRVIEDLPKSVDSAYEKILDRSLDKAKARVLLHIITAAMRPLSLEELSLAWAISMNTDHQTLTAISDEVETKDRFRKSLRDLCGLFVVIIDEKVYLLHQTAKEFLVRGKNSTVNTNKSQVTGWKYTLLPEESNRILADICTSWISLMTLDQKGIKKGEFDKYSSYYWAMHFRQACMQDGNPLIIRAMSLCDPSSELGSNCSNFIQPIRFRLLLLRALRHFVLHHIWG